MAAVHNGRQNDWILYFLIYIRKGEIKMINIVKEFFEVFGSLAVVSVLAAVIHFIL